VIERAYWKWYDYEPWRRFALARWAFVKSAWHQDATVLARLRYLYWTLIRFHDSEVCCLCGRPVQVVFHVPIPLWDKCSGFRPGGGVLCIGCFDRLAGWPLYWTCSRDEAVMEAGRRIAGAP